MTLERIELRGEISPVTLNKDAREVDVVFYTGRPVRRTDPVSRQPFDLTLEIGAADLAPLNLGAPVLDNHSSEGGVSAVLGAVVKDSARFEHGTGYVATLRFSRRAEVEAIFADVDDSVLTNVSVGADIGELKDITEKGAKVRHLHATHWVPREVSLVVIGADPGAIILSREKEETMEEEITSPLTPPKQITLEDASKEKERNETIRVRCKAANLDATFAEDLIVSGCDIPTATQLIFGAIAESRKSSDSVASHVTMGADYTGRAQIGFMAEALVGRGTGDELSDGARRYAHLRMSDIARECLKLSHPGSAMTAQLSPSRTFEMALRPVGEFAYHSTSDFGSLLGDVANKAMRGSYDSSPEGLKQAARMTTAPDFKTKHRIALDVAPNLEKVLEGGEIKHGTIADSEETYALATYARIFSITRQALVNDDLGEFNTVAARFGRAAREFENAQLAATIAPNSGLGADMTDGNPVFDAAHNNVAGSGGAIAEATLTAARLALRMQTALDGTTRINSTPWALVVPGALETDAEKVLATLYAATVATVNPFSARLNLIVDPRLDDISATAWFVCADPGQIDGLEYSYLEGATGPQIATEDTFNTLATSFRVHLDFGAAFVEHRSWYRNAGA